MLWNALKSTGRWKNKSPAINTCCTTPEHQISPRKSPQRSALGEVRCTSTWPKHKINRCWEIQTTPQWQKRNLWAKSTQKNRPEFDKLHDLNILESIYDDRRRMLLASGARLRRLIRKIHSKNSTSLTSEFHYFFSLYSPWSLILQKVFASNILNSMPKCCSDNHLAPT